MQQKREAKVVLTYRFGLGCSVRKNREPDLKNCNFKSQSESSCQLHCLNRCVAYGSPQPAPSALWHTHMLQSSFHSLTYLLHLHPAVRCRLSFTQRHMLQFKPELGIYSISNCLFLKFNRRAPKYWMFPHLHAEATGQSKACEPLSLVSAASTDKRALWHHHFLCSSRILLTDRKKNLQRCSIAWIHRR